MGEDRLARSICDHGADVGPEARGIADR